MSSFCSKNTCELDIVLTRTVNILTTNELVKLKMLWTTGPWLLLLSGAINLLSTCILMSTNVPYYLGQVKNMCVSQWFIYNFIPMCPRTRLGCIKWVLPENHCIHYRIFHYNFVSPGTRWDLKCESQSKNCEYRTRDVQVKKSLVSGFPTLPGFLLWP